MLSVQYRRGEDVAGMSAKKQSVTGTMIATAAVLAAFALSFARTILGIPVPLGAIAAAAALAILLSAFGARSRRAALSITVLLLLGALGATWKAQTDMESTTGEWYAREARAVDSALVAAGDRVHRLERLSAELGGRAIEFIRNEHLSSAGDSLAFRLTAFNVCERLADEVQDDDALPRGMEVGIQLFDARGVRIAWAGWPQALNRTDDRLLASANEIIYTRQVSLYRILTHMMPVFAADGTHIGTVVIEIPLEANYKVNNKFIAGASLADEIDAGMAGVISFEYYSSAESAPARKRRDAAGEQRPAAAGEGGFPSYLQPLSDTRGDAGGGLGRSALVKSALDKPLLSVAVRGYPLRHYLDRYRVPFLFAAKILVLAAFLLLFIIIMSARRLRSPDTRMIVSKALLVFGFVAALRYSLLSFQTANPAGGWKIFDPVIFATPVLWGLMRSAGDLLITAFAFVVILYGVIKIARGGKRAAPGARPPAPAWLFVMKGLLASMVLLGCFELSNRFISMVVVNANPRLIGQAVDFFESQVVVLHLGAFLMLVGIMLSTILIIWGIFRLRGAGDNRNASLLTAAIAAAVSAVLWGWIFGAISLLVLLFVFFAPRFIHREDLVSIVIAVFYIVVIISGVAYSSFNHEYQNLRKIFVQEKAAEITNPSDNWKAFILEDILESVAKDPALMRALRRPGSEDIKNLAFDFWAQSPLSLLGYSSALYVFDRGDSVVSRFTVDMPFRADFRGGKERIDAPANQSKAVLNLEKKTSRGMVLFYRGIVSVEEFIQEPGANVEKYSLGKVIIDVPYFFENLSWAALTGPRTPEILRNVQEGGIEPRLEEPDALLLARLKGELVLESSSDDLPAGISLPADKIQRARGLRWPLLSLPGGACRIMVGETEEPGVTLLAGFKSPSLVWHGLRWSTLLSLYMLFSFAIILFIVVLKQIPYLNLLLPTLTPVRRLEFQQKLVASFLVTALVPAIILGIFSVQMIKNRFIEENKDEALSKAVNAKKTLVAMLRDEFEIVSSGIAVDSLAAGVIEGRFGGLGGRMLALYAGENERASYAGEEIVILRDETDAYIGVFSLPFNIDEDGYPRAYYFYYGRKLDADLLGDVADQVGADVNVYYQGELLASSREGLLASGLINAVMNTQAFKKVSLLGVDHALTTEHAGAYRYQVAYLPLDVTEASERAALSLPLLFQAESYSFEAQKATAVVFGIFALLFAATIGIGLVLARGIFEPLKYLLEGTKRIARGELTYKLPIKRQDEIGTVIEAFNEMTEKLAGSQTALEERKHYLEAILANIGTGVISTDADNRIQTLNNAAETILGIDAETAIGTTPRALIDDGIIPKFFAVLDSSSRSPVPFLSSEITITRDNKRCTIKWMNTKLTYGTRYLGTVFVFEDLTELITSKKLSAWVEMSRQIAHEIKNPLTPIKLSTQFMKKAYDQKSPEFDTIFKESSDTIIHQVDVLKRIAGEFSSFGKMQQLSIKPRALSPLIENIIAPYTHNTHDVAVSLVLSDPDVTVMMDDEAFRKICTNLIENALEAMPGGGTLAIEGDRADIGGSQYLRLSFRDSGQGLSESANEKLFEPYFSTKTTGTGLGLAICRSLSREMGGEVTIENTPDGAGAVATLLLPLA